MAQAECVTSDCNRAGQISGIVKGHCCALCTIRQGAIHSNVCNMIEEAGRADVAENDRTIVLGYN